jgi:hypothetical protein
MICDSKRVAYTRIQPEDLLFNVCQGEKGIYNGRVQTLFLKVGYLMGFFSKNKIKLFRFRHHVQQINH